MKNHARTQPANGPILCGCVYLTIRAVTQTDLHTFDIWSRICTTVPAQCRFRANQGEIFSSRRVGNPAEHSYCVHTCTYTRTLLFQRWPSKAIKRRTAGSFSPFCGSLALLLFYILKLLAFSQRFQCLACKHFPY